MSALKVRANCPGTGNATIVIGFDIWIWDREQEGDVMKLTTRSVRVRHPGIGILAPKASNMNIGSCFGNSVYAQIMSSPNSKVGS